VVAAVAAEEAVAADVAAVDTVIINRIKTSIVQAKGKGNKNNSICYHGYLGVIHNEMFFSRLEISMDWFR
jgi:hypothetical protein